VVLIRSDGSPWRPLVHVRDISRAFLAVLEAPREAVHNQAFNVGSTAENYQIRDLAGLVARIVPGCTVQYVEGGGPDPRCYRVDCGKLSARILGFRTEWTVQQGIEELYEQYAEHKLTLSALPKYVRLQTLRTLLDNGRLDSTLRRRPGPIRQNEAFL